MKAISFFFTCIFLISCNSNTILKKPDNLIEKDKMVNIIADLYIANAAYSVKNNDGKYRINYHPFLKDKYQIDSLTFEKSMFYYVGTIQEREDIYKKVTHKLETQLNKYVQEEKIQDSIKNLKKPEEIEDQDD